MFFPILTWLILACSLLQLVYLLYLAWATSRTPKLTLGDVVHFLYPVDLSLLEGLLDPAAELELRWNLSPRALREAQRRRMRLYTELLRRMAHNSSILAEFDNAGRGYNKLIAGPGSELQEAAIKVRVYCTFAKGRLCIWLWLPVAFNFSSTFELSRLRKVAAVDGLKAYAELKTAAAEAFDKLRPAELELLTHNL